MVSSIVSKVSQSWPRIHATTRAILYFLASMMVWSNFIVLNIPLAPSCGGRVEHLSSLKLILHPKSCKLKRSCIYPTSSSNVLGTASLSSSTSSSTAPGFEFNHLTSSMHFGLEVFRRVALCGATKSEGGDSEAGRFSPPSPSDHGFAEEGGSRQTGEELATVRVVDDCRIGSDIGFDSGGLGVSCPS